MKLDYRWLTPADAVAYVDSYARKREESLKDGLIFSPSSRRKPVEREDFANYLRQSWAITPGVLGWQRSLGAFDGRLLVGECDIHQIRLPETALHRATLGMSLETKYRGQGAGKHLLGTVIEWAKEQTFLQWLDLGVFAHNAPARRLYEHFGFIEIGRTPDLFRVDGHSVDDILMVLDLNQVR